MSQIEVLFDREGRGFRFGDEVTGTVVITANSDFACEAVRIYYGWRTHGRGDRDQGSREMLMLSEGEMRLRAGERREIPFRFQAPMGPATYHGNKLNVDWYLTAYAGYLQWTEDFILLSREPTWGSTQGNTEIVFRNLPQEWPHTQPWLQGLQDVNAGDWEHKSAGPGIPPVLIGLWVMSMVMVGALFLARQDPDLAWFFGGLAILLTVVLLAIVITHNAYKRKLEIRELCVKPEYAYPGSQVTCRVRLGVKQEVYLRSIEVFISAIESVTIQRGTASETEVTVRYKKDAAKTFDELLSGGRQISFECTLPVPPDAPASFRSAHNSLQWVVHLDVHLKGWPGLTRSFPFTVLPAECAPQR